ncbi:MAG: hypothetical protein AAB919_03620 [Patescibacteria group bacterium]
MDILTKVKSLGLPDKQFVVMGSAILELKGIRKAGDIDIIVTRQLFEQLRGDPAWQYKTKLGELGGEEVSFLKKGEVEVYLDIYGGGEIDFFLSNPTRTEEIGGIYFASLTNLLEIKSGSWDRPKDREDARLIKEYLTKNL